MPRSAPPDVVKDTLDNLIRQFSQELCFYRELIQNAIDAGSPQVDVSLAWQDDGLAEIQIVDYGEGMDRRVIDTQLTRLFSSSKEGDFTKIGKFGIGFVSVFAVQPEAVVVETGKGGERWRVIFGPDRQFERLVLDEPIEGTRIRVYKRMPKKSFPDFVKRSRDTIVYWCRHASSEIRFQGETVNQPFDLDSAVRVAREEHGTHVVLGLTDRSPAFFGFYNQGITLLEGHHDHFPGIAFKARSRYLEHTLTRDNVMQDENYGKAMAIVERTIESALLPELLARLAEAALEADGRRWRDLLSLGQAHLPRAWDHDAVHVPMLRCVGRSPCSYAEVRRSAEMAAALDHELGGRLGPTVMWADVLPPRLVARLDERGIVVLEAREPKAAVLLLLQRLGLAVAPATEVFASVAPAADEEVPPHGPALARAAVDLLVGCGVAVGTVAWAHFDEAPALAARPLVALPCARDVVRVGSGPALAEDSPPTRWPLSLLGRQHLVLNVRHPLVTRLAALFASRPVHATHQLAKLVCLADGIHPDLEMRLSKWALTQRGSATRV